MKHAKPGRETDTHAERRSSPGFLLAQVGAHAAAKFRERLAPLGLVPPHAGILRILGASPSITQRALAGALRVFPSRLVALLDELESQGLIERRAEPADRRRHALHLTKKGRSTLEAIGRIAREHQKALLASLREEEQAQLEKLLRRIADEQGLAAGVHPGYARLRGPAHRRKR